MLPANAAAADFNVCFFPFLPYRFAMYVADADVVRAQPRSHNIIDTGKSGRRLVSYIHNHNNIINASRFENKLKKQHRSLCLVSCGFPRTRNAHLQYNNNNTYTYYNIGIM